MAAHQSWEEGVLKHIWRRRGSSYHIFFYIGVMSVGEEEGREKQGDRRKHIRRNVSGDA